MKRPTAPTIHHNLRTTTAIALGVFALAMHACTSGPDDTRLDLPDANPIAEAVRKAQQDWPWIVGTEWELFAVQGEPPLAGTRVSLSFKPDETWVTGFTGCNRFTGEYIRRGENGIRIGPLASTKVFCNQPEGVMQQESRVLHLLAESVAYRASAEWFHLLAENEVLLSFRAVGKTGSP